MANETPSVNGSDPAVQRQVDRQTAGLLPKASLTAAPSVSGSTGTSWGDKGYFYMPYDVIKNTNMSSDFWVIKGVNNP